MENFRDETGKLWTSHFNVTMDPDTVWYEDFFQKSGISDIRLNQARREGNMYVENHHTLAENNQLTLNASNHSEWIGDLVLRGGSTEANFASSQWRGNTFLGQKNFTSMSLRNPRGTEILTSMLVKQR